MHSPDHSTKGTPSALGPPSGQWPLTAGEDRGSGSLSSPLRGAFHLSLTVLVHYRSLKVLSLGGWSPQLPTNSPGFVVLRMPAGSHRWSLKWALTVSGQAFQPVSVHPCVIVVLVLQPHPIRGWHGLGSSPFARHYLGNLG